MKANIDPSNRDNDQIELDDDTNDECDKEVEAMIACQKERK